MACCQLPLGSTWAAAGKANPGARGRPAEISPPREAWAGDLFIPANVRQLNALIKEKVAKAQRSEPRVMQRVAWKAGTAFEVWNPPVVMVRVSADLEPLLAIKDAKRLRQKVVKAMLEELGRTLDEVLPTIKPELRWSYARTLSDRFALRYFVAQQRVVSEAITQRGEWLERLPGMQDNIQDALTLIHARANAARGAIEEIELLLNQPHAFRTAAGKEYLQQQLARQKLGVNHLQTLQGSAARKRHWAGRLTQIEQSIEAQIPELERVERALAVKPIGGVLPLGATTRAGTFYRFENHPRRAQLQKKYPDGVWYSDEGFPDFSPYAAVCLHGQVSLNRDRDFGNANRVLYQRLTSKRFGVFKSPFRQQLEQTLGAKKVAAMVRSLERGETPAGYTWHHHEEVERSTTARARWRGVDFLDQPPPRKHRRPLLFALVPQRIFEGDLTLIPTDLHQAARHNGSVSIIKNRLNTVPQFNKVKWQDERVP